MTIKIKDLREYSKSTPFSYPLIRAIYDHWVEINGKAKVSFTEIEKHVKILKDKGITTVEGYKAWLDEIKQFIEDSNQVKQEPVDKDYLRKKYGYNKKDWEKVVMCETIMKASLAKLITRFMQETIMKQIVFKDMAEIRENDVFLTEDKKWRDWVRKNIIPVYPGGNKFDKRKVLLDLFGDNLAKALKV